VIPQSQLRLEERPARYALVNMGSVFINIAVVFFFLFVAKRAYETDPQTILGAIYDPKIGVGYFILGNLVGSIASLLFLYPEIRQLKFVFDKKLWHEVMNYSYPLLIVGFGGNDQ
jgi:O-antigen/teichoic acid export membrane protein